MSEPRQHPADRCPYPRPFHWFFSECPAFMPRLHLPTDIRGRPLRAHWTCAHLTNDKHPGGGYYAACLLGGAEDRQAWARQMKVERLAAIRLARVEVSEHIRPHLERARSVLGGPYDSLAGARRAEMRAAWNSLAAAFDGYVVEHPDLFAAAGIDQGLLRRCFSEAIEEFTMRAPGGRWEMSEELVGRYPWEIQAFFRPDLATRPSS